MTTENVCCPHLEVVGCADTDEHRHLYCDSQFTIKQLVHDNDWVKEFCVGDFKNCKYFPKSEN